MASILLILNRRNLNKKNDNMDRVFSFTYQIRTWQCQGDQGLTKRFRLVVRTIKENSGNPQSTMKTENEKKGLLKL